MVFAIAMRVDEMRVLSGDDAPLWGVISFDIDSHAFPGVGWKDFLGSVVGSFVTALSELVRGRKSAWVYFFNGSFQLVLERRGVSAARRGARASGGDEVTVIALYDPAVEEYVEEARCSVSLEELLVTLRGAVQEILEEGRRRSITGMGMDVMKGNLKHLDDLASRLSTSAAQNTN
ncbi:hypothetical protein [Streptosporangium carneum]|uniref:Uncharacterized protein n=1 Tax=Streptosporangium carneum TaxID=47481 RepID=A0A9W6MD98_9ACTN|nr:hypothetical protein [Streptosporangium carneum]GLK10284.1 hypothetical protein GCM10017600_36900 [Streptosporangium carneum]